MGLSLHGAQPASFHMPRSTQHAKRGRTVHVAAGEQVLHVHRGAGLPRLRAHVRRALRGRRDDEVQRLVRVGPPLVAQPPGAGGRAGGAPGGVGGASARGRRLAAAAAAVAPLGVEVRLQEVAVLRRVPARERTGGVGAYRRSQSCGSSQ